MKKLLTLVMVIFLVSSWSAWAGSVSGKIIMEFDLSVHDRNKPVQLWIPYPVSDEYQHITKISVNGDYDESAVYTDRKLQNPMLYAKWERGADSRKLKFSFYAQRQEVKKANFPEKEGLWNKNDFAMYLGPTKLGPIDGAVKKLADKITVGKTTILSKAKAIYDWTCENTYRNPKTRGCGSGDVCKLLKDPGGKCADISSVFVALTRASGVPSREIFGIRMGEKLVEDITKWQHCWTEFYLPGYGWMPADPADVRKKMLKEKLKLSDPKTDSYRAYFWGGIDACRIKLSQGRDLILNPDQHGDAVNYLMYPFAQVGEKTLDWLDPETFNYKFTYRQN